MSVDLAFILAGASILSGAGLPSNIIKRLRLSVALLARLARYCGRLGFSCRRGRLPRLETREPWATPARLRAFACRV